MRNTILTALVMLFCCGASPAFANGDFAVVGYSQPYTVSNSYIVEHTVKCTGPTDWVLRYIPMPRTSSYDGIFRQTAVSADIVTDPPAMISYDGGIGAWVFWGENEDYDSGDVLMCTVNASVNITSNVDGDFDDVILDNPDSWTEYSPRAQYIPAAAQIAQQLRDNYASETCRGGYGVVHRIVDYIADTITYDADGGYDANDALSVWNSGSGSCSGMSNLFISMCRSLGIGAGFMMGNTFAATYNVDGVPFYTYDGLHAWSAVDNGTMWIPVEPGGFVGFVTTSRVLEAQAVDQSDVNIQTSWGGDYPPETGVAVSGGGGGESFILKDRWDNGGHDIFVHYPDNSALRPVDNGKPGTVGVPEGPLFDPDVPHAVRVLMNPARYSVDVEITLARPVKQMRVSAYDAQGRVVRENLSAKHPRIGPNYIRWTPDRQIPSGVYFLHVVLNGGMEDATQKVLLLR